MPNVPGNALSRPQRSTLGLESKLQGAAHIPHSGPVAASTPSRATLLLSLAPPQPPRLPPQYHTCLASQPLHLLCPLPGLPFPRW